VIRFDAVHQFHSGTAPGDAITNQMLVLQRHLQSMGYQSEVFAEHIGPELSSRIRPIHSFRPTGRDLLLVHHSTGHGVFDDVVALPALNPDLTVLHVQTVGSDGTVRIKGLTFADLEQAKAAKAVVVTCEEIVPAAELRTDPDQNALPPFLVDAVVCVPYGAHPTACRFFYDYDPAFLTDYRGAARDDQAWTAFLDEWVYGLADHDEYMAKVGAGQLARIKADPVRGYAIGLDRR